MPCYWVVPVSRENGPIKTEQLEQFAAGEVLEPRGIDGIYVGSRRCAMAVAISASAEFPNCSVEIFEMPDVAVGGSISPAEDFAPDEDGILVYRPGAGPRRQPGLYW